MMFVRDRRPPVKVPLTFSQVLVNPLSIGRFNVDSMIMGRPPNASIKSKFSKDLSLCIWDATDPQDKFVRRIRNHHLHQ
jgi:hypothetical protein